MSKKKKNRKISTNNNMNSNTMKFVCSSCGSIEYLPSLALEFFDEANSERILFDFNDFIKCKLCDKETLVPIKGKTFIINANSIL